MPGGLRRQGHDLVELGVQLRHALDARLAHQVAAGEHMERLAQRREVIQGVAVREHKVRVHAGRDGATDAAQAQQAGGSIPYTAIREVSENFIHAQFKEIVVSIFDKGNTIRFTDQGPGIPQKEKAQMPGFSSATSDMKRYIRGVGSGLPLVKEYLSFSHGRITIEDNIKCGSVVTISVKPEEDFDVPRGAPTREQRKQMVPALSDREKDVLYLFLDQPTLRVTDIVEELGLAASSAHRALKKLEEAGLISTVGKMRQVTDEGLRVIDALF